jgi:hypothetical protein
MPIQHHNVSSDSGRTPIDRHAVSAAGQLLMSAIWLEHRVRRFPTHLSVLASPRSSAAPVASSSDAHPSPRGLVVSVGWDN